MMVDGRCRLQMVVYLPLLTRLFAAASSASAPLSTRSRRSSIPARHYPSRIIPSSGSTTPYHWLSYDFPETDGTFLQHQFYIIILSLPIDLDNHLRAGPYSPIDITV